MTPDPEAVTRISTTCYATLLRDARVKLGLADTSTLDDLLKRVIHGNAEQDLSLDAYLRLATRYLTTNRDKP